MGSENSLDNLTYEQAFSELEEILLQMEKETLDLEKSIVLFERGQALTQYCADLLEKAQLRMQQLEVSGEQAEAEDE